MSPRLVATEIGIDPGTTQHAVVYLEAYDNALILPLEFTYLAYDRTGVINLLSRLRARAGVPRGRVALESITGGLYGDSDERRKRFKGVSTTKGKEELFRDLCKDLGIPCVDRPASHGRKKILGNGSASDAQIKAAIEGIYTTVTPGDDLPPLLNQHRPHLYDAMIVGMCDLLERMAGVDHEGARTEVGPLVPSELADKIRSKLKFPGSFLPDDVRELVEEIRREENEAEYIARMREKHGLSGTEKKPRRIPTRAVAAEGKAKAAITRLRNKLARM